MVATLDKRHERRLTLGSFLLFDARSSKSSAAPPLLTLRLSILSLACTAPTPLSHFNNRTRNRFPPDLVDFIVAWGRLVGDGDAIDLRVEVLTLVVGEILTQDENESVETAGQIKVSTRTCLK
jgi:hypothetical protein